MTNKQLPKTYEPKKYEDKIYEKWEKSGVFNPDNLADAKNNYANILPPPNANGELHMGHASGYVTMDLLGRFHRMLGEKTLLLPGKDHGGIQTQYVYEKKIKKERDISRHDLGREKFYNEIYDFCIDRSQYMRNQEKKLGLSADWSREKFTLQPDVLNIALETFVQMYNEVDDEGNRMVYKGERIINWCPRCGSALSDMEVQHKEEKGKLYWIKYGPFVLATTRPETKLGDTAVAVHPNDERYQHMIGKKYMIPGVLGEFEITVVADEEVDMEFGSGAIKVTPAHSFADAEIAARHNLPSKQIINEEGKMMENCGKYAGMTTLEARKAITLDMEKMGLIDHIDEDYILNLSVCERCKSTIEPLPSKQWFVNVDHKNFSLKNEARKAIESEEIKIYPARFKKIMLNWIDNVHDWCISRQIWWGPRIPAWYKNSSKFNPPAGGQNSKIEDEIYVGLEPPKEEDWIQDSDTFDTWFSSGQWAYTTLGYPNEKDYKEFYPSNNMIMGRDILPLWAFRMIILSLYRTRQIPFKNLYFTGLVRDEKGQKMSKSKGNGIEPLEMIEKYGTDAIRMSLLVGSSPGNDINLGEAKIAGYRNMVNKLWNISRFILEKHPRKEIVGIGVLLFDNHNNVILQKRDGRTDRNPNMIAPFGGGIKNNETLKESARREIEEETGVRLKENQLEAIGLFESHIEPGKYIKMFQVKDIDTKKLKINEGNGFVELTTNQALNDKNVTAFTKEVLSNISKFEIQNSKFQPLTPADHWILSKMNLLIKEVTADIEKYQLSSAGEKLRDFTWNDLADWYLEVAKFEKDGNKAEILQEILKNLLKLWHPFIPFVTERIWEELDEKKMLIIENWPNTKETKKPTNDSEWYIFEKTKAIITAIRNARAENKVAPDRKVKAVIYTNNKSLEQIKDQAVLIRNLRTGIEELEVKEFGEKFNDTIFTTVGEIEIYLLGAVDQEKEIERLKKEKEKLKNLISSLEKKLENKKFVEKAPDEIIEKTKKMLQDKKEEITKINQKLEKK